MNGVMYGVNSAKDLSATERIFKALANRRRIAIVRFLKGHKEASVGDIAHEIKLSFRATSKHLTILTSVAILEREQRSLNMFYRISGSISLPKLTRSLLSLL